MSDTTIKQLEITERIAAGEFAFSSEELTGAIMFSLQVSTRTAATTAIAITLIRRDHITDLGEWVKWARETVRLEGSHLHHLHKIGKMMLDLRSVARNTDKLYRRLYPMGFNKLLPLTCLPGEQLEAFCSHYPTLEDMPRETVRDAVKAWPSLIDAKTAAPGKRVDEQPDLPGFDAIFDAIVHIDNEELFGRVDNDDRAQRSLVAGLSFLEATLHYHCARAIPDACLLASIKADLLTKVKDIESKLAGDETED